jgi:hypothetical protein
MRWRGGLYSEVASSWPGKTMCGWLAVHGCSCQHLRFFEYHTSNVASIFQCRQAS